MKISTFLLLVLAFAMLMGNFFLGMYVGRSLAIQERAAQDVRERLGTNSSVIK